MTKVREYHQSELNTFLKCGKQWEFRYVQKIKTPPKAALTLGSSVDAGVTRNLVQKVGSGKDLSLEEVLDVYSKDFDIRAQETEWDEDKPGEQKDMGIKLLSAHHAELAPKIDPETVQEKFVIETDAGFNLGGTLDLTTKDLVVVDTKTAKSKYDEGAVNNSIQAIMYDFAYEALRGKKAKSFRFDVLIKPTKTIGARVQQVEEKVTDEARSFLFDSIHNVHRAIEAGIALPAAEGSWWCSKDWCGYWDRCKGKGAKK
jgi:CRISPR/Cas system-associated exonuclease Cas4 (RecB family)